jgi:hypothetical protein
MKRIISCIIAVIIFASNVPTIAAQEFAASKQYWMAYAGKLPIGSTVQVRTTDGKRITAVLAIVDQSGITLQSRTRIPEPPRHVPYESLDQLSLKENGGGVGKAIAIGAAVGAGSFLGLVALLAAAWD